MARPGITYDQVAAAADALLAETGSATLKAVRERIGTGGMGTIHRHLATWNANRPKEAAPAVELPPELVKGISGWVMQYATAARADSEERLVQLQAEALELSRAGEQLEAERDVLLDQIAALTTERDQAQATAAERAAEIERMTKDVTRERELAGAAQVEAAQAKLKADSQTEQLVDLKAEVKRLNDAFGSEVQRRTDAEKRAAVLESERDAERARIAGLQGHLDKAHQDIESLRSSAAAEIKALRDQYEARLAEAVRAERNASEKERAASVENASLKARLAAAQKDEEGGKTPPSGGFGKS